MMLKPIAQIMQALASIFSSVKRDESIIAEKAERLDIKNKVRKKRSELKIKRIQRKLDR